MRAVVHWSRDDESLDNEPDLRLLLDNVDQGLVTIDLRGAMSRERSRILSHWFGPAGREATIWDYLFPHDREQARQFRLALDAVADGFLSPSVVVDQLPKRTRSGSSAFALRYCPITQRGELRRLLVIVSDVTAEVERERAEAGISDLLAALDRVMSDPEGFTEFAADATEIVETITKNREIPREELRREIHTLKGASSLFGLRSFVELCHELESRVEDGVSVLSEEERESVAAAFRPVAALARSYRVKTAVPALDVDAAEFATLVRQTMNGAPRCEIVKQLFSWRLEPTKRRMKRLADQAAALAGRLGKQVEIVAEDGGVRLATSSWSGFWRAFVHAVRNAVDHGIESPGERMRMGKPPSGVISLQTTLVGEEVVIEIRDDGQGIDWDAIARRARAEGLPHATRADLVEALFVPGISSRSAASECSGRGLGMTALREAARAVGAAVSVSSERGKGTSLTFRGHRSGRSTTRADAASCATTDAPIPWH